MAVVINAKTIKRICIKYVKNEKSIDDQ
jgi:hypothetical protein